MDIGDVTDPNLDGDFQALLEARQVRVYCVSLFLKKLQENPAVARKDALQPIQFRL